MIVFDHKFPEWRRRYNRLRHENGANTYSRDLVRHQIPHWQKWADNQNKRVILSTCPLLSRVNHKIKEADIIVQYLHTYPYLEPLNVIRKYCEKVKAKRIMFLTAYKAYEKLMTGSGFEAYFVPMTIDARLLPTMKPMRHPDKILWFGRIDDSKKKVYRELSELCANRFEFDTIANSRFNRRKISQSEAWQIASNYKYGVGVGRCALEMYALGLKVLVAGVKVGGLVMNENDYQLQSETNFNGRYHTFSDDLEECLENLNNSRSFVKSDIRLVNHSGVVNGK